MPYLDYFQYQSLGGTLSEGEFEQAEPWAEAVLDDWTLNRLQAVGWSAWAERVRMVMARLVDSREAILSGDEADAVSHFSNSVDSVTFADPMANFALSGAYSYARDLLPVELMSRCVSYNGAS